MLLLPALLAPLLACSCVAQDRPADVEIDLPEAPISGIVAGLGPEPSLLFLGADPNSAPVGFWIDGLDEEGTDAEEVRRSALFAEVEAGVSPAAVPIPALRDDDTIAGFVFDQGEERLLSIADSRISVPLHVGEVVRDAREDTVVISRGEEVLVRKADEGIDRPLEGPLGPPDHVQLSEDGRFLASSTNGVVHLTETTPSEPTAKKLGRWYSLGNAGNMRLFKDAPVLVVTMTREQVVFWTFDGSTEPKVADTFSTDGFAVTVERMGTRFVIVERHQVRIVEIGVEEDLASLAMSKKLVDRGFVHRSATLVRDPAGPWWIAVGRRHVIRRPSRETPVGTADCALDFVRVLEADGALALHPTLGISRRTSSWNRKTPQVVRLPGKGELRVALGSLDLCYVVDPPETP